MATKKSLDLAQPRLYGEAHPEPDVLSLLHNLNWPIVEFSYVDAVVSWFLR